MHSINALIVLNDLALAGPSYNYKNPVIANQGDILTGSNAGGVGGFNVFLVDENPEILAVTQTTINNTNSFIVPSGKNFYLHYGNAYGSTLKVNGGNPVFDDQLLLFSGDTLNHNTSTLMAINGYLFDEEFFIDCGAGGGSSSSPNLSDQSENTSNIASQINISNYTGIDCESLNNLNYGDIVFTGQGQSSMVVPGAACGSNEQSSGFIQSNALNTLTSQPWTNYYCFFSVNDTIVLGSIPTTCCMNYGSTSLSIVY